MRFLFCSPASPGYVYPMVGIALELRSRGHSAEIITGPEFDNLLALHGFDLRAVDSDDRTSFAVPIWGRPGAVVAQVRQLTGVLTAFLPHVIVGHQLSFAPLIVTEVLGIPVAQVGFAAYLFPPGAGDGPMVDAGVLDRLHWRQQHMLDLYNEARTNVGLQPVRADLAGRPLLGELLLLQSVQALEQGAGRLPDQVRLVGSCLWEPGVQDCELDDWLSSCASRGDAVVYLQLGRAFHGAPCLPGLVEHLGRLPLGVAMSTDRTDDPTDELPPNFLARPHVPQARVLRHAQAVI